MKIHLFLAAFLFNMTAAFSQNELNALPLEGNIGIGTDSATCKLDIRGQTRIEGDVLITGAMSVEGAAEFTLNLKTYSDMEIGKNALVEKDLTVVENTTLAGQVKMENLGQFATTSTSAEILFIDSDGNVTKGGISDLWLALSAPPFELDYCFANGGIPQWWAGTDKLFTACPEVNVGIATSDPIHKLHVASGTIYGRNYLAGNSGASVTSVVNVFAQNNSQDLMQLGVKIGGLDEIVKLKVKNSGALESHNTGSGNSLTIYNGTGNAAVVYANNGTKILQLEDNGLLNTREIKVNVNTWPDYVFEQNYTRMTLSETEAFISENGRLPGIPSATSVTSDGLNIGQMQVLQMEKMEEIYLHLIELDKRVIALEEENENLKAENEQLKKD